MQNTRLFPRFLFITVIIAVIITAAVFIVKIMIDGWTKEIVENNKLLTSVILNELDEASKDKIEELWEKHNLADENISMKEIEEIDSVLKAITNDVLINVKGIEGGFYLLAVNDFIGYSYPTSPKPQPVYGPPPRSYSIIENQIKKTIEIDEQIVKLHKFDPAVFPLATRTLKIKGELAGALWTRIHIERELPIIKLKDAINIAAAIFIIAFFIALGISLRMKKKLSDIKTGLEKISRGDTFRFKDDKGVFGFIGQSINAYVNQLKEEYSKRSRLEKELHRRDKLAALGKFVAGIAHEVRNPLAIIKTRIQMWQRELNEDNEENCQELISQDSIQLVVKEIDRLTELVKKLLVFSRPHKGNFHKIDVNNLLNKNVSFVNRICTDKDIDIQYKPDTDLPAISGDPEALEQVFLNIVMNSIDFMPDGGTLNISTSTKDSNNVIITITDTGPGIPEENLEKIFDPFFTTKERGTGLGLAISYEIIKTHNGIIEFKNINNGAHCEIALPLQVRTSNEKEIDISS